MCCDTVSITDVDLYEDFGMGYAHAASPWPFTLTPSLLCHVDYSTGFGGRYGVQADRVDQSAVGFDYQGKTEKHESQKGLSRLPDNQHS